MNMTAQISVFDDYTCKLQYFQNSFDLPEDSLLYIQSLELKDINKNSLKDILCDRCKIGNKLENASKIDDEDSIQYIKVNIYNKPKIYVININCDKSHISILRVTCNISTKISIEEIYNPSNDSIKGNYNIYGVIFINENNEYGSLYRMDKRWCGSVNNTKVIFSAWKFVAKWIAMEHCVPILLFYQLDEAKNSEDELPSSWIENIYNRIQANAISKSEKEDLVKRKMNMEKSQKYDVSKNDKLKYNEVPNDKYMEVKEKEKRLKYDKIPKESKVQQYNQTPNEDIKSNPNEMKKEYKEDDKLFNKTTESDPIDFQDEDLGIQWKCKKCKTANYFPNIICSSFLILTNRLFRRRS